MGEGPEAPPLGRKVIEEAACAREKFEGSVAEVSVAVDAAAHASRADDCPFVGLGVGVLVELDASVSRDPVD